MNFNKLNPFKKHEQVPRQEPESAEEEVIMPISDAEFQHKIGMLDLGKNQYLTEIGRTEFMDGVNNAIKNGDITQEQVLRDLKNLQGVEFYEKYKAE